MKTLFEKFCAVVMIAVLIFCAVPFVASAETYLGKCGSNVTWSLDMNTGALEISGTGPMFNFDNKSVPWSAYVDIIEEVNISDGVTTIGDWAFYLCEELKYMNMYDSVETIGECAFYGCHSIESITLSRNVEKIGEYAFYECFNLVNIEIPDSVTEIGESAFGACDNLTSIAVGFSNPSYSNDSNGVLFNKNKTELIQYPAGNAQISYTIPNSVTVIGKSAFELCDNLVNIEIPDSVTKIEGSAFSCCDSLTGITVDLKNPSYFNDSNGVHFNKNKTELIQYPAGNTQLSYTIPNSVTVIGKSAFELCDNLVNITISDSVANIGEYAFYSCKSLTSVIIPDSVTTMGDFVFAYCRGLERVTIPNSIKKIGDYSFYNCNMLTSVIVPNGVTEIGKYAFGNCGSLLSVTISDSVTVIDADAFDYCGNLTSIIVDLNNFNYSTDSEGVLFDKNKTALIRYPAGNKNASYTIPDSVTTIGDSAFDDCQNLIDITIPNSVISIGSVPFGGCKSLTNITVDINNTSYSSDKNGILFNKDKTELIAYPAGNKNSKYKIPNSVWLIENYAFSGCDNIDIIKIPQTVTYIGIGAFSGCEDLDDTYYSGSESEWNSIKFEYGNGLLTNSNVHFNVEALTVVQIAVAVLIIIAVVVFKIKKR